MPSTHFSLHYHVVFSTKDRVPMITRDWRDNLHSYLGGIINPLKGMPLAVGGTEDHLHMLIGLRATHRAGLRNAIGQKKVRLAGWLLCYYRESFTDRNGQKICAYPGSARKRGFQDEYLELLKLSGIEHDDSIGVVTSTRTARARRDLSSNLIRRSALRACTWLPSIASPALDCSPRYSPHQLSKPRVVSQPRQIRIVFEQWLVFVAQRD